MEKLNFAPNFDSGPNPDSSPSPNEIEKERAFFGATRDGAEVYDRADSHFHREGGLTPEILGAAIGTIDTENRDFIKEQIEFDRPIGERTCVEISPDDDVVMVYRKGRSGQTPMVKNRSPEPCNSLILVMRKDRAAVQRGENAYEVVTSYVGKDSPREPWDPGLDTDEEKQKSIDFWNSHALVYDDSLIDWEKTKGYEFMPETEKESELIRQRTIYTGIFVDSAELYSKTQPTLEKPVEHPHITTAFKPDCAQLHLESLGDEVQIQAIGYGNDGQNEGLLVKIQSPNPEIQAACDALETPHITISTDKNGQAKNTAFLEFTPLEEPFDLIGKYGLFGQGAVVKSQSELAKLQAEIAICRTHFDKNQQKPPL